MLFDLSKSFPWNLWDAIQNWILNHQTEPIPSSFDSHYPGWCMTTSYSFNLSLSLSFWLSYHSRLPCNLSFITSIHPSFFLSSLSTSLYIAISRPFILECLFRSLSHRFIFLWICCTPILSEMPTYHAWNCFLISDKFSYFYIICGDLW